MSNQINKKVEEVKEVGTNLKEALLGEGEIDKKEVLTKAAVVGGVAIIMFWLISKMFGKKNKSEISLSSKKKKKKKNESMLYTLVKQQIGIIILAIFRKQIAKFLKEQKLIDEENSL